jgi:amino acid transporter
MTTHGATTQGKFHKRLSLTDLTFIGLGSIFGSGWLFSASHVSAIAGPAGILSWILGGIAVLLLGLVYCELGAALPRAGGVVRYPEYSHGALLGSLTGFITLIAFSSLIAIEVEAARQYAAAWFPLLNQPGGSHPSVWGWLVQLALLVLFFLLNYFSVKTFALANNIVSIFKFLVPILVIVLLMKHFNPGNLSVHGFAPSGMAGVEAAISAGGIIFAYLGLTPIVSVASEVRDPQRNIPIALILSVALSTVIYVLLQLAFLGSIPAAQLAPGWSGIDKVFALPYHDIALALGMAWLAALVICDAMVSPSGTGNIYMNATPRVVYGWARSGGFLPVLTRVDPQSGIPRPALWLSLGLSIFWTLPFPSWETLIGVVSAALVLSYAVAPVTVAALRRSAPQCAGLAAAVSRPWPCRAGAAVVHRRRLDRLLVDLAHLVVVARPAGGRVRAVCAVSPAIAPGQGTPAAPGACIAVVDRVLRAGDGGVLGRHVRRSRLDRASVRHLERGGDCILHLSLGRAQRLARR